MSNEISLLFIGDVVGENSFDYVCQNIIPLQNKFGANYTVINGENIWQGKGLNEEHANALFDLGVDTITTGNHIWENWKSRPLLATNNNVLRPYNYPPGNPGRGYVIHKIGDIEIAVLQLQGRTYMQTIDCPFRGADHALKIIEERTKNIIVDFHCETTAEKYTMAWYLDGRVSALLGTHTHVQTADEQILPKGTAYITDVGMSGPYNSVIGMKKDIAEKRYILQTAFKYELGEEDIKICGVNVKIDGNTGQSMEITKFTFPEFTKKLGI